MKLRGLFSFSLLLALLALAFGVIEASLKARPFW